MLNYIKLKNNNLIHPTAVINWKKVLIGKNNNNKTKKNSNKNMNSLLNSNKNKNKIKIHILNKGFLITKNSKENLLYAIEYKGKFFKLDTKLEIYE